MKKLMVALALGALLACTHAATAQTYPAKPVRIVVGFAPGGTNDILARLLAQWLTDKLGQPFIVENRPGAANNIGTDAVAKSPPDGYTLLMANTAAAINATLYDKLNFNFVRDIAPVAGVMRGGYVVEVHPSFPAKTLAEFIAYAKANPGKLNYGAGLGTPAHLIVEYLKVKTGSDIVYIPHKGGAPAVTDLLTGVDPLPGVHHALGAFAARAPEPAEQLLGPVADEQATDQTALDETSDAHG